MTKRTKAELQTMIGANFPDNTNGDISALDARTQFTDQNDSYSINESSPGFFPITNADGTTLNTSSLQETATEIISSKTLQVPSGSVRIGRNLLASDAASFYSVLIESEGIREIYASNGVFETYAEFSADSANRFQNSSTVFFTQARWQDTFETDTQQLTTNTTTFQYIPSANLVVRRIKLRAYQNVDNVRIRTEQLVGSTWMPIWESHVDTDYNSGGGYSLTTGDNLLDLGLVNFGIAGQRFRVTVETRNSTLPLNGVNQNLGLGAAFYPFLFIYAQDWQRVQLPFSHEVDPNSFGSFASTVRLNGSTPKLRTMGTEVDGPTELNDAVDLTRRGFFFSLPYTGTKEALFKSFVIRSNQARTGVQFTLFNTTTSSDNRFPIFWDADLSVGDNTIMVPGEYVFRNGQTYRVDIHAFDGSVATDNGLSLKTSGGQPFFTSRVVQLDESDIMTSDDEIGASAVNLYNARNVSGGTLNVGDLVFTSGFTTDNDIDYIDVGAARGSLTQLEIPFGIMVKQTANLSNTLNAVADKGAFELTLAGASLFDTIYIEKTGTGQNQRWQFTLTETDYPVGSVKTSPSNNVFEAELDFSRAHAGHVGTASFAQRTLTLARTGDLSDLTAAMPLSTYEEGVGSTDGAMSGADKQKLDGIETGAQVNRIAWRGAHSTDDAYAAGDIVTHLFAGLERLYMATTAQAPNSGTPTSGSAIGAWRLIDDMPGKGTWIDAHYKFGDIVERNSNYWMANTTIPLGSAAPSSTNSSWVQLDGSGTGGGTAPTITYLRQSSLTLTSTTADNTYISTETTGTADVTVNLFDVVTGTVGRRINIANNRASGRVLIQAASGDEFYNGFDPDTLTLAVGQSVTIISLADNRWAVVSDGEILVVPNFPSNPENDNNTFFFSANGDTPTTWTRDMNTRIDLRPNSGNIGYELANPATSGITVANGEGYIFRHTTGNNQAQVFPFSAANPFFVGSTQYTSTNPYVIPLGHSLVVVYSTTTNRWEGRAFSSLVSGSAGAGGASEQTDGTMAVSNISSAGFISTAINRDGDILHSTLAKIIGSEGTASARKATLGDEIDGVYLGDIGDDEQASVMRWGTISKAQVVTANGAFISTPLAENTDLFVKLEVGQTPTVTNDSESGAHSLWGHITSSSYTLPGVAPGQDLGTDLLIVSSGSYNQVKNKTVEFTGQGSNKVRLPRQDVSGAVIGDEIILSVQANTGQTGTLNISAYNDANDGTINARDRNGTVYTEASPYVLTDNVVKVRFVQEEGVGKYWLILDVGEDVVEHEYYFDARKYNDKVVTNQVYQLNATVGTFNNRLISLENPLLIASSSNTTITNENIVYNIQGMTDNTRIVTIGSASSILPSGQRTAKFVLHNTSNQYWVKVRNSNGNFEGMQTNDFWMKPNETREIWVTRDGSTYSVMPIGRISYKFSADQGLLGATWVVNDVISDLIAPVTGNTDRLGFKYPGEVEDMRITMNWLFTGTAAADFASLLVRGPSVDLNKNGSNIHAGHDAQVLNLASASTFYYIEIDKEGVLANDYFTISGTDLTDIAGATIVFRGEYVLKNA